jgi:TIR domain
MSSDINERRKVFISYSHHDSDWLSRLRIHLRPLERDFQIEIWDDTGIKPGSSWCEEITQAIDSAKVAILLISGAFIASDFIATDELPPLLHAARDEGTLILPIIISPSRFLRTPSLSSFQTVNDPSKPLVKMTKVRQEEMLDRVAQIIETTLATTHHLAQKIVSSESIVRMPQPASIPDDLKETFTARRFKIGTKQGYLLRIIEKETLKSAGIVDEVTIRNKFREADRASANEVYYRLGQLRLLGFIIKAKKEKTDDPYSNRYSLSLDYSKEMGRLQ